MKLICTICKKGNKTKTRRVLVFGRLAEKHWCHNCGKHVEVIKR